MAQPSQWNHRNYHSRLHRARHGPCPFPSRPKSESTQESGRYPCSRLILAVRRRMPRRGCASRALAWACCRFRRRSPAVRVPWRGGDGRAFGRVAADRAVPVPTGANTPGPRRNTPPFGYLDNLQSNGCCTFN